MIGSSIAALSLAAHLHIDATNMKEYAPSIRSKAPASQTVEGSMKRNLFLFLLRKAFLTLLPVVVVVCLLSLLVPGRVLADGFGSNCISGFLTGSCVDGQYSYSVYTNPYFSVSVDGPNGVEVFTYELVNSLKGFYVNDQGEFAFSAVLLDGGISPLFGLYTSPGGFGGLGFGPPPSAAYLDSVCPACVGEPNIHNDIGTSWIGVTGLSDTGLISGIEHFFYDSGGMVNVNAYWQGAGAPIYQQDTVPVPEPNSIAVFGAWLLFLLTRARCMRRRQSPSSSHGLFS